MITMSGEGAKGKPTGLTVADKAGKSRDLYLKSQAEDIRAEYGSVSNYEQVMDDIRSGKTMGMPGMTAREALNSVSPQAVDYAMAVVRGSRTTGLGGSSERLGGYEETLG